MEGSKHANECEGTDNDKLPFQIEIIVVCGFWSDCHFEEDNSLHHPARALLPNARVAKDTFATRCWQQ